MFCTDVFRKRFTPLVTTITARSLDDFPQLPRHEGEIQLHTENYEPTRLRQGDGCYFDSTIGHACVSVSRIDALVLWIASNVDGLSSRSSQHRAASK